jgi:flagellin-like protein
MIKNKKGVSPVISTVLLIAIVVILALIIFLWAKGFVKEAILKEVAGKEKTTTKHCLDIQIEPITESGGNFGFRNTGSVPIYAFELKLTSGGDSNTYRIESGSGGMVNPGFLTMIDSTEHNHNDYDKIEMSPILLGKSSGGEVKEAKCDKNFLIK